MELEFLSYSHVFVCALLSSVFVNGADILFLGGFSTRSHINFILPILDGLQSRGNRINVISPYIELERYPNISQIELTETKLLIEEETKQLLNGNIRIISKLVQTTRIVPHMAKILFKHPSVERILKQKPHYDVVITDSVYNEMVLSIAYHLKSPLIFICTSIPELWDAYVMNIPTPYAYVPSGVFPLSENPSFCQRLLNTLAFIVGPLTVLPRVKMTDSVVAEYLPNAPSFDELRKNISLMLVNSDPIADSPRPTIPNVIFIGGIHCREPAPLPKYLEDFIQSSGEHGFILFSFGSILAGRSWPNAPKRAFVQAFSKIKQKVIWKYDEPIEGLSDNVMLVNWIPQQDLLGHPKIRLFINHGGYLSIQEAIYHGVPIIGLPMFAKQPQHVTRAVELGIGERLHFPTVQEEQILQKIHHILNHSKYKETVSRYSTIFRDRPQPAREQALYWIEYVIRYKGAYHLMTSAKYLSIWQYYLIDIVAFLLLSGIILSLVCYVIIIYIMKFLRFISLLPRLIPINKKQL